LAKSRDFGKQSCVPGHLSARKRREVLAYLLPCATSYLGWAVHSGERSEAINAVALLLRDALLAFLSSRRKSVSGACSWKSYSLADVLLWEPCLGMLPFLQQLFELDNVTILM
jgi:hypothetical protein